MVSSHYETWPTYINLVRSLYLYMYCGNVLRFNMLRLRFTVLLHSPLSQEKCTRQNFFNHSFYHLQKILCHKTNFKAHKLLLHLLVLPQKTFLQ